MHVKEKT